jgi:hypothetical protein
MRVTKATLLLLLSGTLLLPVSVPAQAPSGTSEEMLLAPPPGPYVSSRPQLEPRGGFPQQSQNRLPFISNMPAPAVPLRYLPSPRQVTAPPRWFYGPMGR